MDGFPYYLAPFQKWVTEKLKKRAENPNLSNKLMPFAMLSSAAVVKKTKIENPKSLPDRIDEATDLLKKGTGDYNGCVITNTTDVKNLYRTGTLIAGYDLNGQEIVVEGALNSRVSVPIIESIEIDTDGTNNTLRTARVNVRVFTLKQLEMFELFFLRPSMYVVLEFGYNDGFDAENRAEIQSNLFIKKNYENYKNAVKKIFSAEGYIDQRIEYKNIIKKTNGNYEFMPGLVTNYTLSINNDLTYSVTIEISAGNELQMWFPLQQAKGEDQALLQNSAKDVKEYNRWLDKLAAETGRSQFRTLFADEKTYKNEFFNWGKKNDSANDQSYSKTPYISFKLILDIINNSAFVDQTNKKIQPIFKINEEPSIPITSTKYIISASPILVLPGDIASIVVNKSTDKIVVDKETKSAPLPGNKKFNYSNTDKPSELELKNINGEKTDIKIPNSVGNLLNVFVNYDYFIDRYKSSYSLADLMNQLFELINSNMFGLCNLQLCRIVDGPSPTNLTIIDTKMQCFKTEGTDETELYRFKIGAKESIVIDMNFSTELSVLQQAQATYASQLLAIRAKKQEEEKNIESNRKKIPYQGDTEYADFSFAKNSDGYYSLNILALEIEEENKKIKPSQETTQADNKQPKVDLTKIRQEKFIRFKDIPNAELIYMDPALIQNNISVPAEKSTVLSDIELSITIDGTSGISCGEYFKMEGVPEIYNEYGVFQVQNTKHTLDESGWKTTIEAAFRYLN